MSLSLSIAPRVVWYCLPQWRRSVARSLGRNPRKSRSLTQQYRSSGLFCYILVGLLCSLIYLTRCSHVNSCRCNNLCYCPGCSSPATQGLSLFRTCSAVIIDYLAAATASEEAQFQHLDLPDVWSWGYASPCSPPIS